MRPARRLVIAALLCALLGMPGPAARADLPQIISLRLEAPYGPSVMQGKTFVFEGVATNPLPLAVAGEIQISIRPAGGSAPLALESWKGVLAPGASGSFEREVNPAQFFADTGDFEADAVGVFRLQAAPALIVDQPATSLPFHVTPPPVPPAVFEDVTDQMGITTVLGQTNCIDYAQGAAWSDVDGDGLLDLFVPQRSGPSELWINKGDHFEERAAQYGIQNRNPDGSFAIGIGAIFVDYDNDGRADLLVTNDGTSRLYHNDGGSFSDVTQAAGLAVDGNFTTASFADYDADGYLDVFIASHGRRTGCWDDFTGISSRLFHNNGNGTFEDVTASLPIEKSFHGLSFIGAWTDYNSDGRIDLYLGNDHILRDDPMNILWRNDGPDGHGGWTFTDVSVPSGAQIGVNAMGAGVGDYNRDGRLDVAFSNIGPPALMRNDGAGHFTNVAVQTGLERTDQGGGFPPVWWALQMDDFNNDGWDDLYITAGGLNDASPQGQSPQRSPAPQPNAMYINDTQAHFLDLSGASGAADPGLSRGAAFADFDGDGRVDMLVLDLEAKVHLYRNVTPESGEWLTLRLTTGGRDACGAGVLAEWPGTETPPIAREVSCGSTSLSSGSDPAVHFGLGALSTVGRLTIRWPSGAVQVLTDVPAGQALSVAET